MYSKYCLYDTHFLAFKSFDIYSLKENKMEGPNKSTDILMSPAFYGSCASSADVNQHCKDVLRPHKMKQRAAEKK